MSKENIIIIIKKIKIKNYKIKNKKKINFVFFIKEKMEKI
jgi:hypothetical protein